MSSREQSTRAAAAPPRDALEAVVEASRERPEHAPPRVSPEVERMLREEPYCFQFFQAVRLLERLFPDREPVGRFVPPEREVVRFGGNPSVAFPPSDIHSIEFPESGPVRMNVNFMGLYGPNGILPLWYTVLLRERLRAGDNTMRAFLDIFNHRVISLFFRGWEKYRHTISYERGEREGFTHYLLDLIGLGTKGLANRQAVPDDSLIFYAGLLGQRPRSAQGLAQILSDYFDVPVEIEQFLGAWYRLDDESQCCLDLTGLEAHVSEKVGEGTVVGDEVWDPHARVRIKIGPLSLDRYLEFLPNGSAYEPLRALTRFYSNDEFEFEVQLILRKDEVPFCELGEEGAAAPQLGWVTWMKSAPMRCDPQDTILQL